MDFLLPLLLPPIETHKPFQVCVRGAAEILPNFNIQFIQFLSYGRHRRLVNGFTLFITHAIDDRFSQIIAITIIYAYNSVNRIYFTCVQATLSWPVQFAAMLLIFFAAQLNVRNKNTEETAHGFLSLTYLACDLWLRRWLSMCAPLSRFHSHSFSISACVCVCVCRHHNSMLYCTAVWVDCFVRYFVSVFFVWCALMWMSLYESNEWITIAFNFERAISLFSMAHCHH